jgi:hypothetical protein
MENFKKWYKLLVMQGAIDKIHNHVIKPLCVFFPKDYYYHKINGFNIVAQFVNYKFKNH